MPSPHAAPRCHDAADASSAVRLFDICFDASPDDYDD